MMKPLRWNAREACLDLLDQTRLPVEEHWMRIDSVDALAEAIRALRVRGAPAIGIAAAYGVALAAARTASPADRGREARAACDLLATTRPTAVNLFVALDRMLNVISQQLPGGGEQVLAQRLLDEAVAIETEEEQAGRRIGEFGLSLLDGCEAVLTHCHAGGVATAGFGTALAPLHMAARAGRRLRVFVDETRPLFQGSRITAWEMQRAGHEVTLITDSMAAHVMQRGLVDAVFVGADRVAANGDVANKIGTYGLAVQAQVHGVPFYVAVPRTTIDTKTPEGSDIEIEQRPSAEVTHPLGVQAAPEGVSVYNPAFDVTPARLVTAIVTDFGILYPPYGQIQLPTR